MQILNGCVKIFLLLFQERIFLIDFIEFLRGKRIYLTHSRKPLLKHFMPIDMLLVVGKKFLVFLRRRDQIEVEFVSSRFGQSLTLNAEGCAPLGRLGEIRLNSDSLTAHPSQNFGQVLILGPRFLDKTRARPLFDLNFCSFSLEPLNFIMALTEIQIQALALFGRTIFLISPPSQPGCILLYGISYPMNLILDTRHLTLRL